MRSGAALVSSQWERCRELFGGKHAGRREPGSEPVSTEQLKWKMVSDFVFHVDHRRWRTPPPS